jgi:hypothetical protein
VQAQLSIVDPVRHAVGKEPSVFTHQVCARMAELNRTVRHIRDDLQCKVLEVRLSDSPNRKRSTVLVEASTAELMNEGHGLIAARQPGRIVYRLLIGDVEVVWLSQIGEAPPR